MSRAYSFGCGSNSRRMRAAYTAVMRTSKSFLTILKFRDYGDAAVVIGGATFRGNKGAAFVNNVIRFTNVWVKRNDRWQLVSYQATPIDTR